MKVCNQCKRSFPDYLIQPMVTIEVVQYICPLCALKNRNKLHGLPEETLFHGMTANELWQDAKKWLENNDGSS